jgi:hypothetical protein
MVGACNMHSRDVKGPRGKCRCGWEDNIRMYLMEIGWEDVDWMHLVRIGMNGMLM